MLSHVAFLSGWQDSNLRPPAPKAGALTGLRYTPNFYFLRNKFGANKEYFKNESNLN